MAEKLAYVPSAGTHYGGVMGLTPKQTVKLVIWTAGILMAFFVFCIIWMTVVMTEETVVSERKIAADNFVSSIMFVGYPHLGTDDERACFAVMVSGRSLVGPFSSVDCEKVPDGELYIGYIADK